MADIPAMGYALVAANAIVYSILALQLLRNRTRGPAGPLTMSDAFEVLGTELKRQIPPIPRGFTWREAIGELQKMKLEVDWLRLGRELDVYEAYRYGGTKEGGAEYGEVLALAKELRSRR
ncbi:MAG: hypothetical protein KGI38_07860 [Thaumarchaeota archaeon]|nr:hypothetical protein [Nitrososphaerota archaeon]